MNPTIKKLNTNEELKSNHPSYGGFDVLVEWQGETKWIFIEYGNFFDYIWEHDKNLEQYLDDRKLYQDEAVEELINLEYDIVAAIIAHLNHFYKNTFTIIPKYVPFSEEKDNNDEILNKIFEDDDDDDN